MSAHVDQSNTYLSSGSTPWVRRSRSSSYEIGGVEDHVHLYLRWRPDGRVSDLMRTVKAGSSKWLHETFPELAAFAWQEG